MLAKAVKELPAGELALEPKWDGFRCIVFRDRDEVMLGSRNERSLTRYFPELLDPIRRQLPERCVVDGELIVAVNGRLGFDDLQQRIHPAESRVNMLAEKIPASFVAFDLLALADDDLREVPFAERRRVLESEFAAVRAPIHLTPLTLERDVGMRWFERFEGAGLDGLVAKPLDGTYVENKRVQFKLKHQRTADAVVAGFRVHKDRQGVGSLLLGLHDETGRLHHVGVAASFAAKRRRELVDELAPYRVDALDGHPWADWYEADAHAEGRLPGAVSRWNASKNLSWEPIRAELVCEVRYESVLNGRFRATTRFVRWRNDRTPDSCTYDQLEMPTPISLDEVLHPR